MSFRQFLRGLLAAALSLCLITGCSRRTPPVAGSSSTSVITKTSVLDATTTESGEATESGTSDETSAATEVSSRETKVRRPAPTTRAGTSSSRTDPQLSGTSQQTGQSSADEELIAYLLSEWPEARYLVEEAGMAVLISGETTLLDGAVCRDVWLGTDHGAHFARENHYTISDTGDIYEFVPLADEWIQRNGQILMTLAYMVLDDIVSDEVVRFRVDEVYWVDVPSGPNGYLIYNDVVEWEHYTATLWTEFYVFAYSEELGMEQYQVNLDNFLAELRLRDGMMLVDLEIEGDTITWIAERYVP